MRPISKLTYIYKWAARRRSPPSRSCRPHARCSPRRASLPPLSPTSPRSCASRPPRCCATSQAKTPFSARRCAAASTCPNASGASTASRAPPIRAKSCASWPRSGFRSRARRLPRTSSSRCMRARIPRSSCRSIPAARRVRRAAAKRSSSPTSAAPKRRASSASTIPAPPHSCSWDRSSRTSSCISFCASSILRIRSPTTSTRF